MSDVPELDPSPDVTWTAVGVGLTMWEVMESQLATLYSIFKGKPRQLDTLAEFGREGRITRERIRLCEEAGAKYFFARPDQGLEIRFAKVIARARELAINRHQLAHGVVMSIAVMDVPEDVKPGQWIGPKTMWGLGWPWYSRERMHADQFMYGTKRINEFTVQFGLLGTEASHLASALAPQS